MAKNDLTVNIGSKFNGEGFNKLNNAVKTSSKNMSSVTGQVLKISGAIGDIGGKASKVAGKVKGLFDGFAQGGAIGAGIAAATMAVSFLIDKFNEMLERAEEKLKHIKQSITENLIETLSSARQKFDDMFQSMNNARELKKMGFANDLLKLEVEAKVKQSENSDAHRNARAKMTKDYDKDFDKKLEQIENRRIASQRAFDKIHDDYKIAGGDELLKRRLLEKARQAFQEADKNYNNVDVSILDKEQAKQVNEAKKKAYDDAKADVEKFENEYKKSSMTYERAQHLYSIARIEHQEKMMLLDEEMALAEANRKQKRLDEEKKLKDEEKKKADEALKNAEELQKLKEKAAEEERKAIEEMIRTANEQKRRELQAQAELLKKRAESDLKMINEAIAFAEREALKFANAHAGTIGKDFNQWERDKKADAKAEQKAKNKELKDLDRARKERELLQKRIFGRNGNLLRSANKKDIAKWKELMEFEKAKGGENKALNELERLEKEKMELQRNMQRDLADIAQKMKEITL